MKKKSPMLRLWELAKKQHGKLKLSILFACVGVICGMFPYFSAANIIIALLRDETDFLLYLI